MCKSAMILTMIFFIIYHEITVYSMYECQMNVIMKHYIHYFRKCLIIKQDLNLPLKFTL